VHGHTHFAVLGRGAGGCRPFGLDFYREGQVPRRSNRPRVNPGIHLSYDRVAPCFCMPMAPVPLSAAMAGVDDALIWCQSRLCGGRAVGVVPDVVRPRCCRRAMAATTGDPAFPGRANRARAAFQGVLAALRPGCSRSHRTSCGRRRDDEGNRAEVRPPAPGRGALDRALPKGEASRAGRSAPTWASTSGSRGRPGWCGQGRRTPGAEVR
jgi:hypothetical protein